MTASRFGYLGEWIFTDTRYASHPYGIPIWRNLYLHKDRDHPDNVVRLSYLGECMAELHNDTGNMFLHIPSHLNIYVLHRWSMFMPHFSFSYKKIKPVIGEQEYFITMRYKLEPPQTIRVTNRLQVGREADGTVIFRNADYQPNPYRLDIRKYLTFIAATGVLAKILTTQAKLGAYKNHNFRATSAGMQHRTGVTYPSRANISDCLLELACEWCETREPELIKEIAECILCLHTSESKQDPHVKQMKSGIKNIRSMFRTKHCVTISGLYTTMRFSDDDDDNKDSELFATTGLREVQIPSETEVC